MNDDNVTPQEEQWPVPQSQDLMCALAESSQVVAAQTKGPGRPALVCWTRLCLGLVLAVLQGWQAQLDLWRWISFESFGPFSAVRVSDQAIYNRLERTAGPMQHLFEQVSRWLPALARTLSRSEPSSLCSSGAGAG